LTITTCVESIGIQVDTKPMGFVFYNQSFGVPPMGFEGDCISILANPTFYISLFIAKKKQTFGRGLFASSLFLSF